METAAMFATWAAAVLALVGALVGFIFWRRDAPWVKGTVALLALCAGLSGLAAILLGQQIAAREVKWRTTAPVLDVFLERATPDAGVVIITSETDVPFECTWMVVTRNNTNVSGMMLEKAKFYPRTMPGPYRTRVRIQSDRVIDNYLEVWLACESLYYAELGRPKELRVRKFRGYQMTDGSLVEITSGIHPAPKP
jgi:hypothetical protein